MQTRNETNRDVVTHHLENAQVRNLTISNQEGSFKLKVDIHKVDKEILLTVPNSEYKTLLQSYTQLKGVFIDDVDDDDNDDDDDDDDTKAELPVHIVLGASNFSKIKTNMPARTGKTGEAVAELTKFGWIIILTGKENHSNVYLTQSTTHNYEPLF